MRYSLFDDRRDAGLQLAERLKGVPLKAPLVLAIPRGGIEAAAPMARALGAELDVVLSRKLRAPDQPELALGAVSESGEVYLDEFGRAMGPDGKAYLAREVQHQTDEIARRKRLFRSARPQAPMSGRSVIVTDDGIATGSTMIAALHTVRNAAPFEVIVAVPVASSERLIDIQDLCDRIICLHEPEVFWSIGQFYRDFQQVSDERVVELLREFAPMPLGASMQP